jgi:cytochrome c oxidase subunit 4
MKLRRILLVWLGLVVLLALTVGASFAPLGPVLPFVSYAIAAAKAGLVLWFFMELRGESGIHRLALFAGFACLMVLLTLMSADPLTRL